MQRRPLDMFDQLKAGQAKLAKRQREKEAVTEKKQDTLHELKAHFFHDGGVWTCRTCSEVDVSDRAFARGTVVHDHLQLRLTDHLNSRQHARAAWIMEAGTPDTEAPSSVHTPAAPVPALNIAVYNTDNQRTGLRNQIVNAY